LWWLWRYFIRSSASTKRTKVEMASGNKNRGICPADRTWLPGTLKEEQRSRSWQDAGAGNLASSVARYRSNCLPADCQSHCQSAGGYGSAQVQKLCRNTPLPLR